MSNGFKISKIVSRGPGRPDSAMEFHSGLNVISGASDTGKSYLFNCIAYMLGRQNPPASVPNDEGYDTLYLEITAHGGIKKTLKRSLRKGGDYLVYDCPISEVDDSTPNNTLKWRFTKGNDETLPSLLMSLCGLSDKVVRTNKRGTTRPLHFSDLRQLSMIDEKVIIDDRTPIHTSGIPSNRTVEEDVFDFVISGEDSSSVIEKPELKVAKASWQAKVEVLKRMIADLEEESTGLGSLSNTSVDEIETEIEASTIDIEARSTEIQSLLESRRTMWAELRSARSRTSVIRQLIARFSLLKEHYESDLQRLQFVGESDFLMSQVGPGHCPVCGSLLDEHDDAEKPSVEHVETDIRVATRQEMEKLGGQLADLENTMHDLEHEADNLASRIDDLEQRIASNSQNVKENLEPTASQSRARLQELTEIKSNRLIADSRAERIEALRQELESLGDEPKRERASVNDIAPSVSISKARRRFCDAMRDRLEAWQFPDMGIVELDSMSDIVINGQARRTHGKGIRAIIQAAFTITLMTEFKARHPHVVLLDSPLTSFKEKDEYAMSDDIQMAFYRDLIHLEEDEQIVIFENKDPPATIQNKISYHHFSGVPGTGRQGFYPPHENMPGD